MNTPMDLADVSDFEYFNSPEYFDKINGIAQRLYYGDGKDNSEDLQDKLSPYDIISLQFGKDKTKERNEFLEKQKQYLMRTGPEQSSESDQAKLARTYGNLRDPSYDEKILYKPIEINVVNRTGKIYSGWRGKTTLANPDLWDKVRSDTYDKLRDEEVKNVYGDDKETNLVPFQLSIQPIIQKEIDSAMSLTPNAFESKITLDRDGLKNWQQFIETLNHEAHHAIASPEKTKAMFANDFVNWRSEVDSYKGVEEPYRSPSTIKYGIKPSISGITLGSGYEELEKRGLTGSYGTLYNKGTDVNILKQLIDSDDEPIKTAFSTTPESYLWNRSEMPAFMKELKIKLMNKTGKYPTSDQTDEEIEQNRDLLYDFLPNDPAALHYLKSLEFMKTPEGKAMWRGVQKTSPKKDNHYA